MNNIYTIKVPSLGDITKAHVIEVLVSVGESIDNGQDLIILESEKSVMSVPSTCKGIIKNISVQNGDIVQSGTTFMEVIVDRYVGSSNEYNNISAHNTSNVSEVYCDVLVLGSGPGGYSAAFRAADLGLTTVMVEKHSSLGGVCLNVGCIPTKTLLHSVSLLDSAKHLNNMGISIGEINIDVEKLNDHTDSIKSRLSDGLTSMSKIRKVNVIKGTGEFIDSNSLYVKSKDESPDSMIHFQYAIIATGSNPITMPFLPKDERVVDSTGALKLSKIPEKMLLIGGGIISLEIGTIYSSLGANIDLVEISDSLISGADRDLVNAWYKVNSKRFGNLMLNTKVTGAKSTENGIEVYFDGKDVKNSIRYDLILQAIGRKPNSSNIGIEKIGIVVDDCGYIIVDSQMRTNVNNIFAIGDVTGNPMLAHKAVHEAHIAAENVSGKNVFFDAKVIPSVAYTNPEIAWVGLTEDEAKKREIKIKKGIFPWGASGRAISMGADQGLTKLIFDSKDDRILGGGIVGAHAGDLIGEIALAIEMGSDVFDIAKTIHPHPTLIESICMASESAMGTCTDLPPSLAGK
ncbi:dihydrolipoamide dehydrogenase [Candidatus Kinetoplastibacterium blastocrithidii TCC012E]|uniref:Dihydrolipoyl dehydrogenase n=3 Tax=cellular organisms TaxID=131567 RepID=S9VI71_9TRYP|nr:dihydrolipoyl dehydrogenase [Candidatus Kinetoplastibacterium blastocrithidii]AGF49734.1 dihydrolipoamide dehydrogenase [Candidatus Kinetoplastibacterium blastocrithidii TCC012E]EPY22890.1 dihydrolipoamide dehydrogenase [Strigomonas culicis]|eukprot:EPY22890.1 dihydrolipoamide dehydrogenase [Strigomonas culicis]